MIPTRQWSYYGEENTSEIQCILTLTADLYDPTKEHVITAKIKLAQQKPSDAHNKSWNSPWTCSQDSTTE
jgi:hypothetical protein